MGRLDEMAKRKVVELREAGLSFRKIKAVLELENIKVSAQAIYLFLKEFQGRARREAEAAAGVVVGGAHVLPVSSWEQSEPHLRNLLPRTSCSSSDGAGGAAGAERDEDVRIVSVTSLAHDAQGPRPTLSAGSAFARRRHAPSPANPVLVARRRLLDKALLHRARVSGSQSGQQVALSGKSPCFAEGRKVVFPHTDTYDLTTPRSTSMRGLHPGAGPHRRSLQQRSIAPPTPRVGIHLPNTAPAAPPQADPGAPSGLQEQIQSLGAELRNLGVALRVLAEQQGRLEREQAQQTQVQRLILVTLQEVSAKLPRCPAYALRPLQDPALDAIEAFSLEQLGQPAINGFPGGSSFTHSQAPPFAPDAPEPAFPPCSPPSSVGVSAGQPELNIIKVESV